jgi:hypothetical protein
MHQGAFAGANDGGREAAGGGRHRQALGGPGGLLHPRAGHRPRGVPVRPRRVPGRWYGASATSLGLQAEASPAGFQAMFEGRDPTTGELLGRPHGRNAVPAFDVVLRPTKSVSVPTGSATRPPARRCWPPTALASARWSPTWTDTWGPTRPWRCPARAGPGAAGRGVRPPESAVHHCRSVTAASSSGRTTRQRAGLSRPPAGGTGRCPGAGR